jgi:hypothetical protein
MRWNWHFTLRYWVRIVLLGLPSPWRAWSASAQRLSWHLDHLHVQVWVNGEAGFDRAMNGGGGHPLISIGGARDYALVANPLVRECREVQEVASEHGTSVMCRTAKNVVVVFAFFLTIQLARIGLYNAVAIAAKV